MNLGNLFYGFTNDGNIRCLLRKNKVYMTDYGSVNATIYYDIVEKKEFDLVQVDLKTLRPITDIVGNKYKRKRKIIEAYNTKMSEMMDIRELFYANIVRCESKYPLVLSGVSFKKENALIELVKEDVLCKKDSDNENQIAQIVESGHYVTILDSCNGVINTMQYLDNCRDIDSDKISEYFCSYCNPIRTKKRILELDYKKELKKGVE